MVESLRLSHKMRAEIEKYLQEHLPEEACGLLGGENGMVKEMLPVRNELRSAVSFRMDPAEQIAAMLYLEEQSLEIVGIFHSHPRGPAFPSETDLKEHAYPESVAVICSLADGTWEIRAFDIQEGRMQEIALIFH
ncbi:MAG: M67 family metallopeptidase [Anaerolineaceae bacterium]|nr:M67 family metallopeptidase [Anaerolineaceae bacterium]